MSRLGPVLPGERIVALDVLRGFAIFGVLVAYCLWSLGTAPEDNFTGLDRTIAAASAFLVDGKFYTLLALLFGMGFQLQLARGGGADEPEVVRRYLRRLLVLAGFGLAHALLLRNGDILLPYAVAGFLLVPFRRAADRALLAAALLILLIPSLARTLWEASDVPVPQRPETGGLTYLAENFAWVRYWYATAIFSWPTNLSLFLVGFWAGRHGLVQRIAATPTLARRVAAFGLAAGSALYAVRLSLDGGTLDSWPMLHGLSSRLSFNLHAFALAGSYAALLLLTLRASSGARVLRPFAAVGRMALTNYLLQAALIVPFCLAFGLFGHFRPSMSLMLALAVFALQVPFSILWLSRFQFGPAEWLWRRLTYGRAHAEHRPASAIL